MILPLRNNITDMEAILRSEISSQSKCVKCTQTSQNSQWLTRSGGLTIKKYGINLQWLLHWLCKWTHATHLFPLLKDQLKSSKFWYETLCSQQKEWEQPSTLSTPSACFTAQSKIVPMCKFGLLFLRNFTSCTEKKKKKSETKLTVGVLEKDQNTTG